MKKQQKLTAAAAKADAAIAAKNKTGLAKAKLNQILSKPGSKMHHGETSFSSQSSETDDSSLKELSLMELSEAALRDKNLVTQPGSTGARQNQQQKNARDFPLFVKKMLLPATLTGKPSRDPLEQTTLGVTGDLTTEAVLVEPVLSPGPLSSSSPGSPFPGRQVTQVQAQVEELQSALVLGANFNLLL